MNNIDFLATLTKHLLKNGLDYDFSMTQDQNTGRVVTKIELIDSMSNNVIGSATGEDLEEALSIVLATIAAKSTSFNQGLSVLWKCLDF